MRAVWLEDLPESDAYVLDAREQHHLINVARLQENEQLLLLDGRGLQVETIVRSISRREICLEARTRRKVQAKYDLSLALGMPKKEALESCLRQAAELGLRKVFLVRSTYSQMKAPELDRLRKILISGLEQSNGAFLPELAFTDWPELPWQGFSRIIVLASEALESSPVASHDDGSALLVVGPEGGFAPAELKFFSALDHADLLRLPTPILRTPTAVAVAAGFVLGRLLDR